MKIHITALAMIGLSVLPASAQTNYPNQKPITIIVPFAAGSGTDTLARVLTVSMTQGEFKNATFVIENRQRPQSRPLRMDIPCSSPPTRRIRSTRTFTKNCPTTRIWTLFP